jgi:hypothetical protein
MYKEQWQWFFSGPVFDISNVPYNMSFLVQFVLELGGWDRMMQISYYDSVSSVLPYLIPTVYYVFVFDMAY